MAFYNENVGNRILELLNNYPVLERCAELSHLFMRCSLRELQELFPRIVSSIFGMGTGGLGWGLRATTKESGQQTFDMLLNFFTPLGPMLRLCYRLLNDSIKFEFSMDLLPHKVSEMLQTGQYPMFYADLLNIDPFRRQVTSLSLNAFDYYILHFVIHATFPLHKMYPAALQVHNERLKTAYFFLTAEYLCAFLPSSPDGIVYPTNICATVKAPQQMPVPPLQPRRSPKYLKLPNTSIFTANSSTPIQSPQQNACNADTQRSHSWRTESVLHFFIDIWLRYDISETRDLPSSEFVRVARILVKQTHAFANSAHYDQTTMVTLRKISQPMMRARIYPFLRSIISRWPLDNSLTVVLELWLSYLQPWRYTNEWKTNSLQNFELPIHMRYDSFIAENLLVYTQIFTSLLPRFERLDFTSIKNVIMLHRLVKVFGQPGLSQKIYHAEISYGGNTYNYDTPQKHANYLRKNPSPGRACEWETSFFQEEYAPLFGPAIRSEIEQFLKTVYISKMYVQQEIASIRNEVLEHRKSLGILKTFLYNFFCDETPGEQKLREIVKIPDLLDFAIRSLASIFQIEMPNITVEQLEQLNPNTSLQNMSLSDNSDYLDMSRHRSNCLNNSAYSNFRFNPDLLPVQSYEIRWLVYVLNELSQKINDLFGDEMQVFWQRSDFYGKVVRQILEGPVVVQWFDKPRGYNELCEKTLPPRLILRPLASYKLLGTLAFMWIIFTYMWSSSTLGLLTVLLIYVLYVIVRASIS